MTNNYYRAFLAMILQWLAHLLVMDLVTAFAWQSMNFRVPYLMNSFKLGERRSLRAFVKTYLIFYTSVTPPLPLPWQQTFLDLILFEPFFILSFLLLTYFNIRYGLFVFLVSQNLQCFVSGPFHGQHSQSCFGSLRRTYGWL